MLRKYDNRKLKLKAGDTSRENKNELQVMQAHLQSEVSKTVSTLKEEYSKWERNFFASNDLSAPSNCDIMDNIHVADMQSRINIGEQLLEKWGINFLN